MSKTRTVYTAEELEREAWLPLGPDTAAMLRQAAAQARVLAKLREQPTVKQQLDRLLREEGLR